MEQAAYHRHDILDKVWALFEPHLLDKGSMGRVRRMITALHKRCFLGAPHGSAWRDLPSDYGKGEPFISAFAVG
jgi:transposase